MRRFDCHSRIKEILSRYAAAQQAIEALIQLCNDRQEVIFDYNLNITVIKSIKIELESIYFTQMFAYFETCLRDYWKSAIRDSRPTTAQLLASIASRREIPQDSVDFVQRIRDYRNCLMHGGDFSEVQIFSIYDASHHLNAYLSRLPIQWESN